MEHLIKKDNFFDIWSDELTIPIPAIDIVIFTIYKGNLCVLLWQDKERFKDKYAIPGGIVAKGHSLEENFDNILKRETGVEGVYKEQLFTFGDPGRDDRGHVISISYYALVRAEDFITSVDFTKIDLVKYEDIDKCDFLYDHKKIIKYANQRLKWKIEYTNIAKDMLDDTFRISQLQNIYEIVLGEKLDKRNFQKKTFKLGMVEETGELDRTTNRPAKLYRFVDEELQTYEIL